MSLENGIQKKLTFSGFKKRLEAFYSIFRTDLLLFLFVFGFESCTPQPTYLLCLLMLSCLTLPRWLAGYLALDLLGVAKNVGGEKV